MVTQPCHNRGDVNQALLSWRHVVVGTIIRPCLVVRVMVTSCHGDVVVTLTYMVVVPIATDDNGYNL